VLASAGRLARTLGRMNQVRCWAAPLGNCEGKTSREHYVSESFFSGPAVRIQGLHWCKGEPAVVGLASATAKILCESHNSALSPLDAEAGTFMEAIREHIRLSEARTKPRFTPFHIRRYKIRARLLERWLLKVLLNLSFNGPLKIGVSGTEPGIPPADLVETAFGLRPFATRAGMYVASYAGMNMSMGEEVKYSPLISEGDRILGGFFVVAGVHLFLALDPAGPPKNLSDVESLESTWRAASLRWRFQEFRANVSFQPSHVVQFKW
jgi:hypothetical protein